MKDVDVYFRLETIVMLVRVVRLKMLTLAVLVKTIIVSLEAKHNADGKNGKLNEPSAVKLVIDNIVILARLLQNFATIC